LIFGFGLLLYLLSISVSYLLAAFERSREAERRGLEAQVLAREAELRSLRTQIDPHFLFNTLHSISALTTADPPAARRMCLLLGDFLRDSLALGSKGALLKAQSIAVFPTSAAGAFVQKTFERLGVMEVIKDKLKVQAGPAAIPQAVAKGEAELGVFLTNVLLAPGVELAGPFPGDLQQDLVFVGAVSADSKNADAAKAFLDYLKTPDAVSVFKAKGVTPG